MGGGDRDLNPAVVHDGLVIAAPGSAPPYTRSPPTAGGWSGRPIPLPRRSSSLPSSRFGQGRRSHRRSSSALRCQDRQAGRHLARLGQVRRRSGPCWMYWPPGTGSRMSSTRAPVCRAPPSKLMEIYRTTGGNLVAGDGSPDRGEAQRPGSVCQNSRLIERYRGIARNPRTRGDPLRAGSSRRGGRPRPTCMESYDQAPTRRAGPTTINSVALAEGGARPRVPAAAGAARRRIAAISGLETASRIARSDADSLRARLLLADIRMRLDRQGGRASRGTDRRPAAGFDREHGGRPPRHPTAGPCDRRRPSHGDRQEQRGRSIYGTSDRNARRLYDRGRREQDPRLLEEVGRTSGRGGSRRASRGTRPSRGARSGCRPHHPGVQAVAHPRGGSDVARTRALEELAHVYEAENYLVSAPATPTSRSRRAIRGWSCAELATDVRWASGHRPSHRGPARMGLGPSPATVPLPLPRRWHVQPRTGRDVRVLSAVGTPPGCSRAVRSRSKG